MEPFKNILDGSRIKIPFLDPYCTGDIFYGTNTDAGEIITIQIISFQNSSIKVRIKTERLKSNAKFIDKIRNGARIGFGLNPLEIGIESETIEEKNLGVQEFYKLLKYIYTDDAERMHTRALR